MTTGHLQLNMQMTTDIWSQTSCPGQATTKHAYEFKLWVFAYLWQCICEWNRPSPATGLSVKIQVMSTNKHYRIYLQELND